MSRYRAIHCLIWNDDKFPFCSDECQLLFFHLLTSPMSTPFGLYKASLEALAAEKRWSLKAYRKAFREALSKGFVKHDERHLVILIPHFLKYNPPNNPNVLKSWHHVFQEIPDCELKLEFFQSLKGFAEGLGKGFGEAFAEGWRKPIGIQDQDQDQDQDQYKESVCASIDEAIAFEQKSPPEKDYSGAFLQFWAAYPKKRDKGQAWKAWQKLDLNGQLATLLCSIEQHKAYDPNWQDSQYVPHPSTYLNGRRWEDELSEADVVSLATNQRCPHEEWGLGPDNAVECKRCGKLWRRN